MTTTPELLRDQGMQAAEDHADRRITVTIDTLIDEANASGQPWSANTIRDRLPVASRGLVGARVRAAAMRRPVPMVKVSEEPSTLPSTHGKSVTVWVGVVRRAFVRRA